MGFSGLLHNRKSKDDDKRIPGALKSLPEKPREFKYKDLKKATNNFNDKLKVGQGRVSVVYKGVLPSENVQVAVKKFKRESMMNVDGFLIELRVINCVRHKHLVRLLASSGGFSVAYSLLCTSGHASFLARENTSSSTTMGTSV